MSHPSDRLDDERAGHVVRPRQLLASLTAAGHEVRVSSAAERAGTQQAASVYRSARSAVPRAPLLAVRDALRVVQNESFGRRLSSLASDWRPHAIVETQVAFSCAGASAARASGALLVLDDVSPVAEDEEVYDVQLRRVARRRRARALGAAGLVVVTSSTIAEEVVREGVASEKVFVLPRTQQASLRARRSVRSGVSVRGTSSRPTPARSSASTASTCW